MARRNRAEVVVADEVGVYHCVQRIVRRAFLCGVDPLSGKSYEHRRDWIRDRLEALAGRFGVEVATFAVMSNQVHAVLRNRPDVVVLWSDEEVARRWLGLFPGRVTIGSHPSVGVADAAGAAVRESDARSLLPDAPASAPVPQTLHPREQAVAAMSANPALMATLRGRLSSLSWFMRALAEPIARRANREDQCTGHFWEGRFKSQRLLDEAALLACSVYVDLNPIRAGLADRPEDSKMTSAHERIMAMLHDAKTKPENAQVAADPVAEISVVGSVSGDASISTLISTSSPVAAEESAAAATLPGPAAVVQAELAVAEAQSPRDGWLSPVELDERTQQLTTAAAVTVTEAAAVTKPAGSIRPRRASDRGLLPMSLETYLELLDWTGRQLRAGASGMIPAGLESILVRLRVTAESWLETVARFGRRFHRAVGLREHLKEEAQRLGVTWLHGQRWSQAAFAGAAGS